MSDESGRSEVYLAAERTPGARTPISVEGGTAPRWREDGRELFFLASGSRVMSARVDWRDEPVVSTPVELFRPEASTYRTFWDVQPDGERFLLNLVRSDARREPIEVVSGWQPPGDRAGSR